MSNLRQTEAIARRETKVKISRRTLDDLELWLEFLDSSKYGISINRVIFRKPAITTFSYSLKCGIVSFCPQTGIGWRYHFTEEQQQAFNLNTKEYIASSIDMEVQSDNTKFITPFPRILNRSDSSSTVGCLHTSNHDPINAPIHNEVAKFYAHNMMTRKACNYSQHFPGKLNIMTDSFSRAFHLSNDQIISILTSLHPSLSTS